MSMVIHFEIPADDIDRARNFYSSLFNWDIRDVPGRNNYLLITTSGEKAVSSSLIKRFSPKQTTIMYFDVPSVDGYSAKVQQLGGKVIVSRKAVPGTGYFAICLDTENNTFGIWEENKDAR